MFTIILTPAEITYLINELKLAIADSSPLEALKSQKLSAAKSKDVVKALRKGKTLVADRESGTERVNLLVTGALGILANPEAQLEIRFISPDVQQRRYFLNYQHTWLELLETDQQTYIITTPINEAIIRNFVFQELKAGNGSEQQITLSGAEIIVASLLFDLQSTGKTVSLDDIQTAFDANAKPSFAQFRTAFGDKTPDIAPCLRSLTKSGYLKLVKGKYQLTGAFARLAAAIAYEHQIMITRLDLDKPKQGLRTLNLIQGAETLYLQQTIVAKVPVVVYREISLDQAVVLLSLATFSPDNFVDEFKAVFAQTTKSSPSVSPPAEEIGSEQAPAPTPLPKLDQSSPPPLPKPESTETASAEPAVPIDSSVKHCPQCSEPLPDGAKFCRHCGHKTEPKPINVCPQCSEPLPDGAKFCRHCGHKL